MLCSSLCVLGVYGGPVQYETKQGLMITIQWECISTGHSLSYCPDWKLGRFCGTFHMSGGQKMLFWEEAEARNEKT